MARALPPWLPEVEATAMGTLLQDLRYAARTFVQRPGFTFVALLALALGIGSNTAIFSVVNAVVLQPLPFHEPERLVLIFETMPDNETRWVAPANFLDWRRESRSFEGLAGYGNINANLTGGDQPERVQAATVSAGFFDVLGVQPALGRTFLPDEEQPGSERVAVLGHGLWQRRFGSDPEVVGRSLSLDGQSTTIVGVLPSGVGFPEASISSSSGASSRASRSRRPTPRCAAWPASSRSGIRTRTPACRRTSSRCTGTWSATCARRFTSCSAPLASCC
jgi:hypothetical protein